MADYSQLMDLEKKPKRSSQTPSLQQEDPTSPPNDQSINQSIHQSTDRSIEQLTRQHSNSFLPSTGNKILDKPKAFYITERLNKRIDEAVRYLQEIHGISKADRSTVVCAI